MIRFSALVSLFVLLFLPAPLPAQDPAGDSLRRYLYVAQPGIRNYVRYGGHGLIVFDINNGYKFVKRIPTGSLKDDGTPWNVKGVCGNAKTGRLYVSTIKHLICIDLHTDKVLWEKSYDLGCDRMSISPDGWITFSIDGRTCWSSTGDVIDTKSRKIVATLTDEKGRMVMSEKVLEVDFRGNHLVAVGDQFGKGHRPAKGK